MPNVARGYGVRRHDFPLRLNVDALPMLGSAALSPTYGSGGVRLREPALRTARAVRLLTLGAKRAQALVDARARHSDAA